MLSSSPIPRLPAVPSPAPPDAAADTPSAAAYDYRSLFLSQRREARRPVALRLAEGSLPASFPRGVYYLAGPGVFSDDLGSTVHPFDGHGYLRAFRFLGAATYAARYVETEAQREERDGATGAWRFRYRGAFSVLRGGRRLGNLKVVKNVANTSVVWWGGRLLCLWEGGEPYEVDPETMATIGPFDVVGSTAEMETGAGRGLCGRLLRLVLQGLLKMPPKRVLSHYKIDTLRKRLLLLSCNAEDILLPRSNFTFYEFDEAFELIHRKEFSIPEHLMIHDWAFTDNHYIIIGNRIKIDVQGAFSALSGHSPMIATLSANPDRPTSPIYVLPRFDEAAERDWRRAVEAPEQMWVIHTANAFEHKREGRKVDIQLQATTCSYHWFNFSKMFGYNWRNSTLDPSFMNTCGGGEGMPMPTLVEMAITIDMEGSTPEHCALRKVSSPSAGAADFPVVNPAFAGRRNDYVYVATTSGTRPFLPHFPYDSIAKVRLSDDAMTMWRAGHRRFVGEPVFIPRGEEEDEGYIVAVEYAVAKERCNLVILDARRIGEADAMVAKLEVPEGLAFPLGFHGFWLPHYP